MAKYQIRNLEDDSIAHIYDADEPQLYGGPWGNPDWYVHELQPQEDVDAAVQVQKWSDLRHFRNGKLAEDVDKARWAMSWAAAAATPWTTQQQSDWAAYRQALLDVPENVADIDEVVVAEFTWPTKPDLP